MGDSKDNVFDVGVGFEWIDSLVGNWWEEEVVVVESMRKGSINTRYEK